jgi:osmotically-inducible protein OsmY
MDNGLSDQPFKLLPSLLGSTVGAAAAAFKNSKNKPATHPKDDAHGDKKTSAAVDLDEEVLVKRLRHELSQDPHLSEEAKNIRIVSHHGTTKFFGPVRTQKEKFRIAQIARTLASTHKFVNNLQVTSI